MKSNLKIVISVLMILPILAMPTTMLPEVHAMQPATWSHTRMFMQMPKPASSLSYYNHVSPADCTHYATTSNQCSGTDTTYGTFSYVTPESYGTTGSCSYSCESQDVYVNYPSTFTYNGATYYFSTAQQDQCATNFGCSTETTWSTTGPVDVPYSGTPVGIPVTIDTQIFYEDSSNTHEVEIDFTYNLDYGYNYG
ncbi:MAG: hypothetical protein ACREA8_03810 [Nitrosotalea sp.]